MKKILFVLTIIFVFVLLFAGAVSANTRTTHMSDVTGRTCFQCHAAHQASNRILLRASVDGKTVKGYLDGYTLTGTNATDDRYQNVSSICIACHDGTGAPIPVVERENDNDYMWHAGVFDFNEWPNSPGSSKSAHTVALNMNSIRPIAQAPGNTNRAWFANHNANNRTAYRNNLSCTSCHNPHGNSEKQHALLHLNPNESVNGSFVSTAVDWTGKEYRTVTLTSMGGGVYGVADGDHWLRQYVSGTTIRYPVAIWLNDTWVMNRSGSSWSTINFQVSPTDGQIRFTGEIADPGLATLTARVFRPIFVEVDSTVTTTVNEVIEGQIVAKEIPVRVYKATQHADVTITRESVGLNRWCMGCHEMFNNPQSTTKVDYPDGSHYFAHIRNLTPLANYGVPYTQRGATAESNCLSCHYAHGTNNKLMLDANKTIIGSRDVVDMKPANKRYIGGSLCIRCHQGFSNRNNTNYEFYLRNTDTFWDSMQFEDGFNANNNKWY